MFEYLIIGAGVTGITLCKKLREKGIDNVVVLEALPEAGGLCRTRNIDGNVLDIGGGHFFHTKFSEVFDYVFQYIPKQEFNYIERISKIEINGKTIDYPIESNIWQLPEEDQIEYIISVVRNGEALKKAEPNNYEEWIRWKLGEKICDEYMVPYNKKLWGVEPSEMDLDWLYKIPRVEVKEVLKYCLEQKQDKNKFPAHINFYYPKKGGFQRIVDALVEAEKENIVFNFKVEKLDYKDDSWIVNDEFCAKNVINTTPWNDLYQALDEPVQLRDTFRKIKYNRIIVSLCKHNYDADWHWRYIPDMDKQHHREFYIGNYAEDSKKCNIYTETELMRFQENKANRCFDIMENYITDAAYPIPVLGHQKAIDTILKYYQEKRLYGIGRWGQHSYQNADVSMYEAIKFVENMI